MILAIDVGNTSTTAALFPLTGGEPVQFLHYPTIRNSDTLLINSTLENLLYVNNTLQVTALALSSVVPEFDSVYSKFSNELGMVFFNINVNIKHKLAINYDNPAQLGVDRFVNAEAAHHLYKRDMVIVDIGTATTICVILAEGIFDGGLILPGPAAMKSGLLAKASRLPEYEIQKPVKMISHNTIEGLQSGSYYGVIAQIEGLLQRIEKEYNRKFLTLITGGYASLFGDGIELEKVIDPLLTLKGIKLLYDWNDL